MLALGVCYLLLSISSARGDPFERPPLDHRSLIWILPWFSGLAVISYLGQYGGTKLIPEWIDLAVVAAFSLVICCLAVRLRLPSDRVAAATAADEREVAAHPELTTADPVANPPTRPDVCSFEDD